MTNFQVYRKTLSFSLVQFLVDMLALFIVVGAASAGFFMFQKQGDTNAVIGLGVGLLIGIVIAVLISIFITNRIKAAQIAMMTKGVVDGELPAHAYKEGFIEIKGRFGKITAFFAITSLIKGIFRQIGRGVNKLGTAVGGQVGDTVTSVIDGAVQTLIAYLCDCCLGWILYRKDENSFKAGCEGCVIFFEHGKTLIRNIGRIFGMGVLSFIVIGGAFFGLSYFVFNMFPTMFQTLSTEIIKFFESGSDIPEVISNPKYLMLFTSAIIGIVMWSTIHSVLIRPFIFVGVLRNFMNAGKAHMPSEADFNKIENISPKFRRLRSKAQ